MIMEDPRKGSEDDLSSHTEKKRRKEKRKFKKLFEKFVNESNIPAVCVLNKKVSVIWKYIWFSIILIGLGMSIYQSVELVKNYLKYPSFIMNVEKFNRSLYFPAVTLCPTDIFNWQKVLDFGNPIGIKALEEYAKLNETVDPLIVWIKMREMLMNELHSMESRQREDILNDVTDWLYSFFGKDAEGGFFTDLNLSLFDVSYSPENGYCITLNPGLTEGSKLRMTPKDELSIIGEIKQDIKFPYLPDPGGIHLSLHSSGSAPVVSMYKNIIIFPGEILQISVKTTDIQRLPSPYASQCENEKEQLPELIRNFSPYQREKMTYSYSTQECVATCTLQLVLEKEECYLAEFAINETYQSKGYELCSDIELDDKLVEIDKTCIDQCPKRCREFLYDWSVKTSKLLDGHSKYIKELTMMSNNKHSLNDIRNFDDFFIITINMESGIYLYSEETAKYELEDIFSSIGGNLGLWIGLSFLSAFEIFELLINVISYFAYKLLTCKKM